MAVAANVRLVRCPKCENLLPELPNFSLYKCGGCGAVLKAKKKGIGEDGMSDISADVRGIGISEAGSRINAPGVHMESGDEIERSRVERIHNERAASNGSSTSRTETESDVSRRGKQRIRRMEQFDDEYSPYSHGLVRNGNQGTNRAFNANFHAFNANNRTPMDQWGVKNKGPPIENVVYHDEGPSSYEMNSYYEHGERTRYPGHDLDGLGRVENLENGRAELLRKLDELKDQLSRSCEMTEAPKEMAASYLRQTPGLLPYTDRYGSGSRDPFPQRRGYPQEYANNTYQPEMLRGPHSQYMHNRPYDEHFPGYYGKNVNHDPVMLHPHENFFHQPEYYLPPRVVDPSDLHNRRTRKEPFNPNIYGGSNLHNSHSRGYPGSESDGFNRHHVRKSVAAHRSIRVLRSIAGGAPFVACSNCFELLKLPRKHISLVKKQQKIKCGACSSIILFTVGNDGFLVSVSAHVDQVPTELIDGDDGSIDENMRYCHGGSNSADTNNDYDKKSNSSQSEKHLDHFSSTSSLSQDDNQIPGNILPSKNHGSPSPDLSFRKDESFPHPEHNDNCSDNIMVGRFDNENKSKRSELERVVLDKNKNTSRQNSVRDEAAATEMDVSNEFINSCVSQDSMDISKEDHPRVNKGGESFFAGIIKKSFKDYTKLNQNVEVGESQVYINGHLISDRVVKKAEKLAGPIQPGDYWYDSIAGFWGVMGHPCLGIIMPNIEEFNIPLPENCAAGNTGVLVNGRELHQKDLDLLVSRGLPNIRDGSYLVEISGKVIDEHTGEELPGLGKLAPTVERAKHGFGMKVPKFLAQSKS